MSNSAVFTRDRTTWLAYLALGLYSYLETVPGPLMPFLQAELGLSYGVASLHFGAFSLGTMTIGVIGAHVTQRVGRARASWGGAFGMAAGVGLLAGCPWVAGTIAGAALMGLAGTLLLIAIQSILSDHHGERRTIAFAESTVAAGTCSILATLAVGSLARTVLGWRAAAGLAVVAVVALAAVFRGTRLDDGPAAATRQGGPDGRLPSRFWACWSVMALGSAAEWCMVFWGATFLERALGFEKASAAGILSLLFAGIVIGRFIGSRLARRMSSRTILLLAQVAALLGFPLFWLAASHPLNVVGLLLAGIGMGNFYPMTLATAAGMASRQPERVSARLTLASGLAGLVAPVTLGRLADQLPLQQAFGVVLPLLVAAAAVTVAATGERRPARAAIE